MKLNPDTLKVVVIDEADVLVTSKDQTKTILKILQQMTDVPLCLFSATFEGIDGFLAQLHRDRSIGRM